MQTELANTINDENIEILVRTFYPMVLDDALVGPFFIEKLGDDIHSEAWEEHLVLLSQFWAFVALGDDRYTGHPMAPHFEIAGISRKAFEQWLKLFHEAVDKVYVPRSGAFFKEKSTDIASNFMRNLSL
ncbi:group III truncated hemoglobin [Sulfurovum sp.]|uniref:group III truncated hemoglobin n=1 Tax=Sulfurovum sp. TaxID=1969726 RepID=UPI0025E8BA64|nr:group III truncated hemoglobin [Sulfurovum sp.]